MPQESMIVWVPFDESLQDSPLRVCVALRREGEGGAPRGLVILRDHPEALVLFGAVLDASNRVQAHLEVWLQRVDLLHSARLGERQRPTNGELEERWNLLLGSFREVDPDGLVATGWEDASQPPRWLCPESGRAINLRDSQGRVWSLCRDDDRLRQVGDLGYAASRARWLAAEGGSDPGSMVEVGRRPVAEVAKAILPDGPPEAGALLLNPAGGRVFFRRHRPLLLEDYVSLLTRGQLRPAAQARLGPLKSDTLGSLGAILESPAMSLTLTAGAPGSSIHLLECLYLKLSLFSSLLQEVRQRVLGVRAPLLNLTPESFQIELGTAAGAIPVLWAVRPRLTSAPDAIGVKIPGSELHYFVRTSPPKPSVFQPGLPGAQRGECEVNFRSLNRRADEQVVFEATLEFASDVTFAPDDLCRLSLNLAEGDRLDVFGHLRKTGSSSESTVDFVGVPQVIGSSLLAQLPAEGTYLPRSSFELVPQVGLPWDFYALGVIAVWMFLGGSHEKLQELVMALRSAARKVGNANTKATVPQLIEQLLNTEPELLDKLGAQNLVDQDLGVEPGTVAVPMVFWAEVLGAMMTLFPGLVRDSVCSRLGGGGVDDAHVQFQSALNRFGELARRARSLLMVDWQSNAEINRVIAEELGRKR